MQQREHDSAQGEQQNTAPGQKASQVQPIQVPRSIGGYELGARLGIGGMAEVYEAFRHGPHGFRKRVALKRILPQVASDADYVTMFVEEAALAARLHHPNIVHVFDFGDDGGELYLAMELVEGTSVGRMLRVLAARGEAFALDVVLQLTVHAARALQYAHRLRADDGVPYRLVHRDVSPANLLVTKEGHLKLTDFGIARTVLRERHTDSQNLRGKIGYMSPEQVTGQDLSGASDVFTLATVMAEMLIGETLFSEGTDLDVLLRIRDVDLSKLHRSKRTIPSDVRKVLLAALAARPDDRPDAGQLADLLEGIMCRRGMAVGGAQRVARLLQQHELVEGNEDHDSCVRPTALVGLDAVSDPSLEIGPTPPHLAGQCVYRPLIATRPDIRAVQFPELVRLTTTGLIDAGTQISRDRRDTVRAGELPELSRIFATPALQWRNEEISCPRMRGELSAAVLLPLIHSLYARRETGMLYLSDGDRRKKVYFVDGRPDFVASTTRKEMLGQYLIDHGHCLEMEMDMALAMLPQHGGRLGDALVNLGVLRPVQLYRAVAAQVRSRYLEAFRWRSGRWLYVRSAESREETYPIEQDAQLLMRDAALELHPSELEAALSPLWERVLREHDHPPAGLSAYQLPDAWRWVIQQANGEATVGALFGRCARQSGLDEEDAMRAIFLGVSCQLLQAA